MPLDNRDDHSPHANGYDEHRHAQPDGHGPGLGHNPGQKMLLLENCFKLVHLKHLKPFMTNKECVCCPAVPV